ncbi:MAG: hypothetical protein ACHBN1_13050 [Heteroscytonema crispum UTEX LB 1556]
MNCFHIEYLDSATPELETLSLEFRTLDNEVYQAINQAIAWTSLIGITGTPPTLR